MDHRLAFGCMVVLCVLLPSPQMRAQVLGPAKTVEESHASYEQRLRRLLKMASESTLPEPKDDNDDLRDNPHLDSRDDVARLSAVLTAKMLRGERVEAEEQILLDPSTRPFAEVGSSFREPGRWCARRGDYDFSLIEYLRILLVAREIEGSLSAEAQSFIRDKLLILRGGKFSDQFRLPCFFSWPALKDTENHRLMMAVSQYLTNQILIEDGEDASFDNRSNGMSQTLLALLKEIFDKHFEEYNSRPYQQFSLQAIHLLYGYAREPEVRQAARLILDYASLWMSLQSIDLRRFSPFRRQPQYRYEPETREPWVAWKGDGEVARWAFLAGNYTYAESQDFDYWTSSMLTAAVSHYRIPEGILSLALDKARNPYYIVAQHRNFEAYAGAASYLLSAGGIFDKQAPPAINDLPSVPRWIKSTLAELVGTWTDQQHGWSMPSVLIPEKDKSSRLQDLLRFEGHSDAKQRANTCIAPGVLCGASLEIPVAWAACGQRQGAWTFYALDGVQCPQNLGLYLAILKKECPDRKCREQSQNGSYGLVEVTSDPSQWPGMQAQALLQGEDFTWDRPFVYRTSGGFELEMIAIPRKGQRSIRRVEGQGHRILFPAGILEGERWQGLGVKGGPGLVRVAVPAREEWIELKW